MMSFIIGAIMSVVVGYALGAAFGLWGLIPAMVAGMLLMEGANSMGKVL